jgi:hypothetical protein
MTHILLTIGAVVAVGAITAVWWFLCAVADLDRKEDEARNDGEVKH